MHWNEGQHSTPHFHARYSGQKASFDFDGAIIVGALPRRASSLVAEWGQLHRNELAANWELARAGQPLQPIDPLP